MKSAKSDSPSMTPAGEANKPACDDLLSLEQAARYLGLDQGNKNPGECVRWLCRQRKIKHVKIGKRLRIKSEWLAAYVERQAVAPVGW